VSQTSAKLNSDVSATRPVIWCHHYHRSSMTSASRLFFVSTLQAFVWSVQEWLWWSAQEWPQRFWRSAKEWLRWSAQEWLWWSAQERLVIYQKCVSFSKF